MQLYKKEHFNNYSEHRIMNRKKGIILSAFLETLVLAVLVFLFFSGVISFNLFIALAIVVGVLFSTAVLIIIKNSQP